MSMNEEIHHLKRIRGHRLQRERTKKRTWVGPKWEEVSAKERTTVNSTELRPLTESKLLSESRPLIESRPVSELRPVETSRLRPWWKLFSKSNVVSVDVEKVNLVGVKGLRRVKPGKIGIVNHKLETLLKKDVYHKPGSFLDGYLDSAVSGITRYTLINGEQWNLVKEAVKKELKEKLVITVAGQNDFYCLEVERDDMGGHFDLQSFYRRPSPEVSDDTQPMSLRDIYFYHFGEDCQKHKPHSAVKDAEFTMRIFLEGYIPLKLK